MKDTTLVHSASYVSWILGQSAAMLGVVLCLIWGFDLVLLIAQQNLAAAQHTDAMTADVWHPPFGPSLIGLGIALAGWLAAHLSHLRTPAPVLVGAVFNLLALLLAMVAAAF